MEAAETLGRRERKKRATRAALSDAALDLFLKKGYDNVTVAEVAEAADTAVTTLFKHFPGGKETLVFGGAEDRAAAIAAAIRERPEGTRPLDALQEFIAVRGAFETDPDRNMKRRLRLIAATPVLSAYAMRRWVECEGALAEVLAAEVDGVDAGDVTVRAVARYALEVPSLASLEADPRAALTAAFDRLRAGWPEF
ncbi:TetR/AcrR family transcriptional regulator [Conexibacter woesei]|uniref:TetR/AcrR family transcriptional regulator n=1 Tax=Conexibacter woesei TaxID=191495 RepID=UPI00041B3F32|nr:TetR family transcriptional regulator [Conexibacter woesei]